jgi:hypothetical protein
VQQASSVTGSIKAADKKRMRLVDMEKEIKLTTAPSAMQLIMFKVGSYPLGD